MSQHIGLNKARCICCQRLIVLGERVAAGILISYNSNIPESNFLSIAVGNPPVIKSFVFPAHGHKFRYIVVYKDGEDWRLCRHPPCPTCQKSPKNSVFHVDCFKLAKSMIPTLSPHKLLKLNPHRIPWSIPDLARHTGMGDAEIEMLDVMKRVRKLPLELRQIIIRDCNMSPLWRYCTVTAQYSTVVIPSKEAMLNGN